MRARRGWGWPLVPVYWAGLQVKDGLRAAGVLPVRRLGWPVVSVGSLSAGGAGKTPVVIALAELLKGAGWGVDVLSRGYGREGVGVERVLLSDEKQVLRSAQDDKTLSPARRFGDEPVLIAERTGVDVWVGSERFAAGKMAEGVGREAGPSAAPQDDNFKKVHLLDDGFQHRQLGRAMDVVVVTAEDLEEALLPAGNRREPLAALRRADVVVVREEELGVVEPRLRGLVRSGVPVWVVRRRLLIGPEVVAGEPTHRDEAAMNGAPSLVAGQGLVAFCGIARPEGFFAMLRGEGLGLVGEVAFPDHYRYTIGDVSRLVESCHLGGGDGFVTTEKDAVKIGPELRAQLETAGPLHVARLEAAFADPEVVVRGLEARLG